MFNRDENDYLKQILEKQCDILKVLKNIDNNIVKYFGEENELKEKELCQKLFDVHLTRKQFEVVQEVVNYTKEKYSKRDDICMITNLPCCYCQPVCGSREGK